MTDLFTPAPQGLPPMTLEQAVELINRVRTIQNGLTAFLGRNATPDSLLDHASSAYKAAILLFDHAVALETSLQEVETAYTSIYVTLKGIREHPVDGVILEELMNRHFTQSDGS